MSLPTVQLDDRDFNQLVEEAKLQIAQHCPAWTDLSPGDPGMMLLELFAHLTETMIYRLNRLPEKAYVEFLRLLGVKRYPPTAAHTKLTLSLDTIRNTDVLIPRYLRVTVGRYSGSSEPPVFITKKEHIIKAGTKNVTVEAVHGEMVEAELIGTGTGTPGLSLNVLRPPICHRDLCIIGVEQTKEEYDERVPTIMYNESYFRIWKEVDTFANSGAESYVYVIDRMAGKITFPPALQNKKGDRMSPLPKSLGSVIPKDREIRAWYLRGGGSDGNVAKNMLTVIKDPLPGIQITACNSEAATGGGNEETIENVLKRGPLELRSLQRAVTSEDFELIAKESTSAVARAYAFAQASIWRHAQRGTVELLLVPAITEQERANNFFGSKDLIERQTETTCEIVQKVIDKRRPIGTDCSIGWVKYKTVKVNARVVIFKGEDAEAVKKRVFERLYKTISPLPNRNKGEGWQFGEPLRASLVYDIILEEKGVRYVDWIRLEVDEVPDRDVIAVVHDAYQKNMWYAGCASTLFRTWDNALGWESIVTFSGESITCLKTNTTTTGMIALVTGMTTEEGKFSRIYISRDCGENWNLFSQTAFEIEDIEWSDREGLSMLFLATDAGLYELSIKEKAVPVQIIVDRENQKMAFYAVTVARDARGAVFVAVASQKNAGVYISDEHGRTNTFQLTGLKGKDIRLLAVQQTNERTFLWAGVTVIGYESGEGGFRLELREEVSTSQKWIPFNKEWLGGSCSSLTFYGARVFAGSYHGGILTLDSNSSEAKWIKISIDCGLPTRDEQRLFHPIKGLAVPPVDQPLVVMAAGPEGVYCSKNTIEYRDCSKKEFIEKVTLPPTWLFCSGEHILTVESENDIIRD